MKGIITRAVGGFFFPADEKQHIYQTKMRGKVRDKVYPGDIVEFNGEMIEALYPRNNLLHRPNIANVEQVLVIQSLENPVLDRTLLDRFLIMVEATGLEPLIVINKIELARERDLVEEFSDYQKAGYKVFLVSVMEKQGIEELIDELHDKITVLTGPSGVGKSSIINQIIGSEEMKVGIISHKLKRGTHTTRHVELLPVNKGGWVADTPGFTSLEINHIPLEELTYFYPEFEEYLDNCKFRGCSHTHEPGCTVKKAVSTGNISIKRYQTYKKIYEELTNLR